MQICLYPSATKILRENKTIRRVLESFVDDNKENKETKFGWLKETGQCEVGHVYGSLLYTTVSQNEITVAESVYRTY